MFCFRLQTLFCQKIKDKKIEPFKLTVNMYTMQNEAFQVGAHMQYHRPVLHVGSVNYSTRAAHTRFKPKRVLLHSFGIYFLVPSNFHTYKIFFSQTSDSYLYDYFF